MTPKLIFGKELSPFLFVNAASHRFRLTIDGSGHSIQPLESPPSGSSRKFGLIPDF
jgi:hypothetical protein